MYDQYLGDKSSVIKSLSVNAVFVEWLWARFWFLIILLFAFYLC